MPIQNLRADTIGGRPYGNERTNPEGSPYLLASPTELDAFSTSDLKRFIFDEIFNTQPENYFDSLKLNIFTKPSVKVPDDVFTWKENPLQRIAVTVDDGSSAAGATISAATAASAGGFVTRTVPVPAAAQVYIQLDGNVSFGGGVFATVTAFDPTNNLITLTSLVSKGIPAIIQGARLPQMGEIVGDSQIGHKNTERSQKVERNNSVGQFRRAVQYGRKEYAKLKLNKTNNNLQVETENVIQQLKFDALVNHWVGAKDTRRLSDGNYAKGLDGIDTQMRAGGSAYVTCSAANLPATFEANAVSTNYQSTGGVRNIYGHPSLLLMLSKAYKDNHTRYTPDSSMAKLDLEVIQLGGQLYRLVPVEPFGDPNFFNAEMANRLYVIDDKSLQPVEWEAFPMFDMLGMVGDRNDRDDVPMPVRDGTQRRDTSIRDAELTFSLMMKEPRQSFAINVTL